MSDKYRAIYGGATLDELKAVLDNLNRENEDLRRTMRGSRSVRLHQELEAARNEIARLNGQTNWQCQCGGTVCSGQKENEQLRALIVKVRAYPYIPKGLADLIDNHDKH